MENLEVLSQTKKTCKTLENWTFEPYKLSSSYKQ